MTNQTTFQQEKDFDAIKKQLDEMGYSKFQEKFVNASGIPTIPNEDVLPEWNETLNETFLLISTASQFFASLAFKCQYQWTWAIPTACAHVHNGKFYVTLNPFFFMNMLEESGYRSFVVMHEIVHIFYDHGERAKLQGHDPYLWNVATDHYINLSLGAMADGLRGSQSGGVLRVIPQEVLPICYDTNFVGMTEDEIYKKLSQDYEDQKDKSSGDGEGEGDSDGEGSGGQSGGDGGGSFNNGQVPLDQAPESHNEGEGRSATANQQAIAEAVMSAEAVMKATNYQPGTAEAGLIRACIEAHETKVDWKSELREFVSSSPDELSTYAKVNRRNAGGVVFPCRDGDSIRVFFGLDSSGSMGADALGQAVKEVQGIVENFSSHHIDFYSCDTKAYEVGRYSSDGEEDEFDALEVAEKIKGFGGTVMSPLVNQMQEPEDMDEPYDVGIILTDGYLSEGDITNAFEGDIPLIVVITEHGQVPSWLEGEVPVIQMN